MKCFICKKVFTKASNLNRHLKVHSNSSASGGRPWCKRAATGESSKSNDGNDDSLAMMVSYGGESSKSNKENIASFPSMVPYAIPQSQSADAEVDLYDSACQNDNVPVFILDDDMFEEIMTEDGTIEDVSNTVEDAPMDNDIMDNVVIEDVTENVTDNDNDDNVTIGDTTDIDVDDADQKEKFKKMVSLLTRKYLRREIRKSRGRVNKKIATARLIKNICGKELEDDKFFRWLSAELSFPDSDALNNFLK